MTHPDLDRLTCWVHGFLEPGDAAAVGDHVAGCDSCRTTVDDLRDEARFLEREMAPSPRLIDLKERLLRTAGGHRSSRGLVWQIPVAAAVLFGLIAALLSPGARHHLVGGRVALEDGRVVEAPTDLAAAQPWQLRAVDDARVLLADHSTVHLAPGARVSLAPGGPRGVQPGLAAGEATFEVAEGPQRLSVISPAGRAEAADGKFVMRIVFDEEREDAVNHALAGAIITVLAGSVSLANAEGTVEATTGQSAVLARAQAPLFVAAPQDKQEDLLRRLEQLAARVAKLEEEVVQLEQKNKQLKQQLGSNVGPGGAAGGAWGVAPGQSVERVRVTGPGGVPIPGGLIIELHEEDDKKVEKKNPAPQGEKK